jgi:hypothetical protein
MWEEMVVAYFKELFRCSIGETPKNLGQAILGRDINQVVPIMQLLLFGNDWRRSRIDVDSSFGRRSKS